MPREIAAGPAPRSASDLIATLSRRAPRTALAIAAGQAAWPAVQRLRGIRDEHRTYTVKVTAGDDLYDEMHGWVLDRLPLHRRQALTAWSGRRNEMCSPGDAPPPPSVRLRYDGSRVQAVTVDGHKIRVSVADGTIPEGGGEARYLRPPEIMFTAQSAAGRDALVEEMRAVLAARRDRARRPSVRMLDQ